MTTVEEVEIDTTTTATLTGKRANGSHIRKHFGAGCFTSFMLLSILMIFLGGGYIFYWVAFSVEMTTSKLTDVWNGNTGWALGGFITICISTFSYLISFTLIAITWISIAAYQYEGTAIWPSYVSVFFLVIGWLCTVNTFAEAIWYIVQNSTANSSNYLYAVTSIVLAVLIFAFGTIVTVMGIYFHRRLGNEFTLIESTTTTTTVTEKPRKKNSFF